jgi:hypothetical protein
MEKSVAPKVGLVPTKTSAAKKKGTEGIAPLSSYFSPIQNMRKGVGGRSPKETEFALVVTLAKTGVTLDPYSPEESLMLNLEKQMNIEAKQQNFEKAAELQIGVNELRMCVAPKKEAISRTKMVKEVAQKAFKLAFSQEDWTSCPLWKEIIAAADHLLVDHEKQVWAMKMPVSMQRNTTNGGVESQRTADTGRVEAPGTEAEVATEVERVATVEVDNTAIDVAAEAVFDPLQEKRHSQARTRKTRHYQTKPENLNRVCGLTKKDRLVMTKQEFAAMLNRPWTGKKLANGDCYKGPNKHNHGLELVDGKVHCFVCNDGKAKSCPGMPSHLGTANHQRLLPSFRATNPSKQAQIISIAQAQQDEQLVGQSWDVETREYR